MKGSMITGLLLAIALAGATHAQTTYYVDDGGSGACTSWGDACPDLQTALGLAISGDQIWVGAGTYKPDVGTGDRLATFQLTAGVEIYGGFDGTETMLGERAGLFDQTVLSGDIGTPDDNSDNCYSVVTGSGTDATAVLDGFTVTGAAGQWSAGMRNSSGSPTVLNCTFTENMAGGFGGGMLNSDGGSPTVTNCMFSGNSAGSYGGGMLNAESSPTVTNCTFSGNSAYEGGGMCNSNSSPTVTNCTFTGNSGDSGGGMSNVSGGNPIVANCIFWGDTGDEIFNDGTSSAAVTYSNVQGGYAGTGNIDADPLLDADGVHLLDGSPCVNAGDPAGCGKGVRLTY